jgi:hypothetical protein
MAKGTCNILLPAAPKMVLCAQRDLAETYDLWLCMSIADGGPSQSGGFLAIAKVEALNEPEQKCTQWTR